MRSCDRLVCYSPASQTAARREMLHERLGHAFRELYARRSANMQKCQLFAHLAARARTKEARSYCPSGTAGAYDYGPGPPLCAPSTYFAARTHSPGAPPPRRRPKLDSDPPSPWSLRQLSPNQSKAEGRDAARTGERRTTVTRCSEPAVWLGRPRGVPGGSSSCSLSRLSQRVRRSLPMNTEAPRPGARCAWRGGGTSRGKL